MVDSLLNIQPSGSILLWLSRTIALLVPLLVGDPAFDDSHKQETYAEWHNIIVKLLICKRTVPRLYRDAILGHPSAYSSYRHIQYFGYLWHSEPTICYQELQ